MKPHVVGQRLVRAPVGALLPHLADGLVVEDGGPEGEAGADVPEDLQVAGCHPHLARGAKAAGRDHRVDDAGGGGQPHRDALVRVVGRAGPGDGDVREGGVGVGAPKLGDGRGVGLQQTSRVGGVFSNVASNYDLMNDAMTAGTHRLWKDKFVRRVKPRGGEDILDMAGGTGDIAFRLKEKDVPCFNRMVCFNSAKMIKI